MLDGTLIETDRCRVPGPSVGVDLWWSGKHKRHGGNIQVLSAPDGFPLWTSPVRPGREHDMTCARTHGLLTALDAAAADGLVPIADTGYEGAPSSFRLPHKKPTGGELTPRQRQFNKVIGAIRALAEKANADLKTRFKALRHVSLSPQRIGDITAAALAIFHFEGPHRLMTTQSDELLLSTAHCSERGQGVPDGQDDGVAGAGGVRGGGG